MNVTDELGWILEAAEARRDQWQGVADGKPVTDLTDELYEAKQSEAASIAHGLSEALLVVNAVRLVTEEHAVTAMCIWEACLENQIGWQHSRADEPSKHWLAEGEGAAAARDGCLTVAPFFDAVWDRAHVRGFEDCFDWDMVPWVLDYVVEHYESPTEVAGLPDSAIQKVANEFLIAYGD